MIETVIIGRLVSVLASQTLSATTLGDGSGVLVDLAGMEVLTFNETGMLIVNQLRHGVSSLDELVAAVTAEFEIDEKTAREHVVQFLDLLASVLSIGKQALSS
jgi:hypothetical protein